MLRREAAHNLKRKNDDDPGPQAPKRPRTETPQATQRSNSPPTNVNLLNQAVLDNVNNKSRLPPLGWFNVGRRRTSSPFPAKGSSGALSREAPPRRVRSMPNMETKTRHVQSTQPNAGTRTRQVQGTPEPPVEEPFYAFPIPLEPPPSATQASVPAVLPRHAIHDSNGSHNGYSAQVGSEGVRGSAVTPVTTVDVLGFDLPFDPDLLARLDEELGPLPLDFDYLNDPIIFTGDLLKDAESTKQIQRTETRLPNTRAQAPRTKAEAPLQSGTDQDVKLVKSSDPQSSTAKSAGVDAARTTLTQASTIDYKSLFNHNVALFRTAARPLGQYFCQDFWSSETEFQAFVRNVGTAMNKSYDGAHGLTVADPQMVGASAPALREKFLTLLRWSRSNRDSFTSMMAQGKSYSTAMNQLLPKQVNDWIRGALLANLSTLYGKPENWPQTVSKDDVKAAREAALALVEYEINERNTAIVEQWAQQQRLAAASTRPQGQAPSRQSTPLPSNPTKRRREADDTLSQDSSAPDHGRPQKRARGPSPLSQELNAVKPELPPRQGVRNGRRSVSTATSTGNTQANLSRSIAQRQQSWEPSGLDFPELPSLEVASPAMGGATQQLSAGQQFWLAQTNASAQNFAPDTMINGGETFGATGASYADGSLVNHWGNTEMKDDYFEREMKKLMEEFC
ncbi:hypothetical protein H2200_010194 [Cladophialophora chaetospira]|uniref:Uncharacterized protein n=1 Tax=Cladophialophora chaetospira TaxID=386627 RepID=A0AA38X2M5_9EURO|nr:hypothetical protein H2200_010194 [Cladophialophora chaetospira]